LADFTKSLVGDTFQLGYVTTEMGRALELLKQKYAVKDFLVVGPRTLPLVDGRVVTTDMAIAWVGAMMVEVIEPIEGDVDMYRNVLPDSGFALRLHHLASPLRGENAREKKKAELAVKGIPLLFEIETPVGGGIYADTYDDLGHHLEFFQVHDPEGFYSRIPQSVEGFDPDFWRAYC
jgi:hypothetical protein